MRLTLNCRSSNTAVRLRFLLAVLILATALPLMPAAAGAHSGEAGAGLRLWGQDRYETSLAVAQRFVLESGGSIDAAVVVSGVSWQDAVIASGLAGSLDAPVLLSRPDGLSREAKALLVDAGVSRVVVVGDADSVSDDALADFASLGSVERVTAADPSAASVAVARRLGAPGEMATHGRTVVVASSEVFADSLVAGGFSARGRHPVLLTAPDALDVGVMSYVASSGVQHAVVMGGTEAVSAQVQADLEASGVAVTRLGGDDRFHTARLAAEFLEGKYSATATPRCFDRSTVGLATARVPFDALSAGPLLAKLCAPLLLSDPGEIDPATAQWINARTHTVVAFGGTAAVSAEALAAVSFEAALSNVRAAAADQRDRIVAELAANIGDGTYGVGDDGVLRGPAGFQVDLGECPDGWDDDAGITDAQIRIGYPAALSGDIPAYAGIAAGMAAYFDWVNENDPVAGRHVTLVDAASPDANTQDPETAVDSILAGTNVLSLLTLRSSTALAVYDRINDLCVPHPFVQSALAAWGDPQLRPWTTGSRMSYPTEALLWGAWIETNLSAELPVRVGAVVMDNSFGRVYEDSFAAWAEANPAVVSEFVAVRHRPAEITAEHMRTIANAEPDVIIAMTAGTTCASAMRLADSTGLASAIRSREGAMLTSSICDNIEAFVAPAGRTADGWWIVDGGVKPHLDPYFASEPFIRLAYNSIEATGLDVTDPRHYDGYLLAYPYVEALRIAEALPGGLSRTNLMLAVRALDIDHPLLREGVRFRLNGAADAYPVEASALSRFDADSQRWIVTGPVIDVDGQTPPCHWSSSTFGDTIPSCGTTTLDRLTELEASGAAGPLRLTYSQAQTHRTDRLSPQHQLKPGYWQPTQESSCAYWDIAASELKEGDEPGVGVVRVNGEEIPFDQMTRIRLEHGDTLTIGTLSGADNGATSCHWQWTAELG
ncbi:cell wall-binding repeat-containing protein [Candidatus Poriferisodalis sp.]|uniref:cell wall-binding repeat-containing protein n=1 Tax=Candidatus Poriferisodalis sp. TaxID=3101277 RepID=UPI003B52C56A